VVYEATGGEFSFIPQCVGIGLVVTALCPEGEGAFCEFVESLPGVTLVEYERALGVDEVDGPTDGALLPGVSRQLVVNRPLAAAVKDWAGRIRRIAEFSKPGPLRAVLSATGERGNITLEFNGVTLPFSADKYNRDPDRFFAALGIGTGLEGGYTGRVARFLSDGNVEVALDLLDVAVLWRGIDFIRTTDLPRKLVTKRVFVDAATGQEIPEEEEDEAVVAEKRTTVVIAVSVSAAVIAISLIAIVSAVLLCRRKGRAEKSSSSDLSSPEYRRDRGLLDE
jgi:hypothetical protein